ncbi:MAG: TorF family putative porin [Burkholderiaceae bacterium]|nr:TorF family putative porin [Burkholderiaceae bacterium]
MNKKALLACAAALATAVPAVSYADVAFNVGAFTDYRYRGISQTRLKPAVQAGVDYSNGPFYLGAWASNIKWIKDFGGNADIEIDLYGGYKGAITKELGFDVGVLTYQYPSNRLNPSANTTELYGALTYGPATLKYSHALTNTFANPDSKNSYYLDLSAGFDLGAGLTLTPHIGYQKIKGPFSDPGSYTDYALTLSKDFSGIVVSGAIVGTDADKAFYASPVNGKELGKTSLVVGVKYNF